jgi:hypothetical protein
MVLERTPTGVVETVETPAGTLETVRDKGAVEERFTGSNRSQVEESASTLRDLMQQKKQEMMEKKDEVAPQDSLGSSAVSLEITANQSTAGGFGDNDLEHVVIANTGESDISLDGYTLRNDNPDSYSFEEVTLEVGESIQVYSNDPESVSEEAVTGTGLTWANGGDTAQLLKDEEVVVESSY